MTLFPGSLTDVQGLKVGHYTDTRRPTGCTVVLCEAGVACGVDVRGAAPGTRETDLLAPGNLVDRVHALLLAGGSAFGLDAAGGVMRWLDEHGHGFVVGPARVPIVPAAVLFDLWLGDARIRPDAAAGFAACEAATAQPPAQGNVGAGAGATVGKLFGIAHAMKGGIGSASLDVNGVRIAALVAVNAAGDVIDPATARVVAGSRQLDGRTPRRITAALARGLMPPNILPARPPRSASSPPTRRSTRRSAHGWRPCRTTVWRAASTPCTPPAMATRCSRWPLAAPHARCRSPCWARWLQK